MELSKLSKELDEGSLSKGVGDAGVEGEGWVVLGEDFHPAGLIE